MKAPMITAGQLRSMLSNIDRKDMTISELTTLLWEAYRGRSLADDKPADLMTMGCWINVVDTAKRCHPSDCDCQICEGGRA